MAATINALTMQLANNAIKGVMNGNGGKPPGKGNGTGKKGGGGLPTFWSIKWKLNLMIN